MHIINQITGSALRIDIALKLVLRIICKPFKEKQDFLPYGNSII